MISDPDPHPFVVVVELVVGQPIVLNVWMVVLTLEMVLITVGGKPSRVCDVTPDVSLLGLLVLLVSGFASWNGCTNHNTEYEIDQQLKSTKYEEERKERPGC